MRWASSETFGALQKRVYSMFVTPERFASWFGMDQVDVPMDKPTVDVRHGHQWLASCNCPWGVQALGGQVFELGALNRVVLNITEEEPANSERTPATAALRSTSGGTELTLVRSTPSWPAVSRAALEEG